MVHLKLYARITTKFWDGPYWVEVGPRYWSTTGGGRIPRCDSDGVLEYKEANDWTDLDWTHTTLHRPESRDGWISPDGRFFGCESQGHDMFAWLGLKQAVKDLEQCGWVRVYWDRFKCHRRLTAMQRNTLSRKGHEIKDED